MAPLLSRNTDVALVDVTDELTLKVAVRDWPFQLAVTVAL